MPRTTKAGSAAPLFVHLVDDQPSARLAIGALMEAVGYHVNTYPNAESFLSDVSAIENGCVLLDGNSQSTDPMEVFQAISLQRPDLPTIIMSSCGTIEQAVRFLKAGAYDFIEKPFDPDHLLRAITNAIQHQKLSQHETGDHLHAMALLKRLTPREAEILKLLMMGESTKAIARQLDISPRTIDVHRGHIMEKLEARSVADAVRTAMTGRFR